jgi:hypothetical protein
MCKGSPIEESADPLIREMARQNKLAGVKKKVITEGRDKSPYETNNYLGRERSDPSGVALNRMKSLGISDEDIMAVSKMAGDIAQKTGDKGTCVMGGGLFANRQQIVTNYSQGNCGPEEIYTTVLHYLEPKYPQIKFHIAWGTMDEGINAVGGAIDEAKNNQLRHAKGSQLRTGTKDELVEEKEPVDNGEQHPVDSWLDKKKAEKEDNLPPTPEKVAADKASKEKPIDEAKNLQLKHTKGLQLKVGTKVEDKKEA